MKAVFIVSGETGGEAKILDRAIPEPGAEQVLVRVHASALNRGELLVMAHLPPGGTVPVGIEYAGEITAVGSDVRGFAAGDKVMGHTAADAHLHNPGPGAQPSVRASAGMAEYVLASPRSLMRMPPQLSFAEAAAFPNAFATAHDAMVTNGRLSADDTVLINAATSGIGTAAVQIARLYGARKVIGVARKPERLEAIAHLGFTHGIATDEKPLVAAVQEITGGHGVDLLVDSLGSAVFADNLKVLALDGRLVSVGRITGNTSSIDLDYLALRRLSLIGVTWRTRTREQCLVCVERCAAALLPALAAGEIKPVISRAFPLENIAEAYAHMRSNDHIGKIVITMAH